MIKALEAEFMIALDDLLQIDDGTGQNTGSMPSSHIS